MQNWKTWIAVVGIFALFMGIAGGAGKHIFGTVSEDTAEKTTEENTEEETDAMEEKYYSFDSSNGNSTEKLNEEFKLLLRDTEDTIDLKFENSGKEQTFYLSIYYDYKQCKYAFVGNKDKNGKKEWMDTYKFSLKDGEKLKEQIALQGLKKDKKIHKLAYIVSAGADGYSKDRDELDVQDCITYCQNVVFDKNANEVITDKITEQDKKYVEQEMDGFYVSPDLEYQDVKKGKIKNLPIDVKVKSGDTLTYSYVSGADTEEIKDAVIFAMIDGKNVKLNQQEYIWVKKEAGKTSVGNMEVELPSQKGIYELIFYEALNPFQEMSDLEHYEIEEGGRATVEVE